jgi:hypothetical protein
MKVLGIFGNGGHCGSTFPVIIVSYFSNEVEGESNGLEMASDW